MVLTTRSFNASALKKLRKDKKFFNVFASLANFLSYLRSIINLNIMKIDLTHVQPYLNNDIKTKLESRISSVYKTV